VTTTGRTVPFWSCVLSLKALTKSIICRPCWERAGPTGGAAVACPPVTLSLTIAFTFLAIVLEVYAKARLYFKELGFSRASYIFLEREAMFSTASWGADVSERKTKMYVLFLP